MVTFKDIKVKAEKFAEEYKNALNNSKSYARAAKKWGIDFDGALMFVFKASGEMQEDFSVFLDLKAGQCLGTTLVGPGQEPPRPAPMVITAPLFIWKMVIFGKAEDAVTAIMQNKLVLKGDMALAMRYAQAAIELVKATGQTDRSIFTQYDLGAEEASAAPVK